MTKLFDQLVIHKEDYREQLKKILPSYIKRSQESIFFVKKIYDLVHSKNHEN